MSRLACWRRIYIVFVSGGWVRGGDAVVSVLHDGFVEHLDLV